MGDRNNPIKFGPEWLRNLARERSGSSAANNQSGSGAGQSAGAGAQTGSHSTATGSGANTTPKVLLAKLRYGREEMLALYDRSSEAPPELIYNEALYHPRGKPPIALNNTFEDEVRDPVRSGPPLGGMSAGDRFGMGRGPGRGSVVDTRSRGRTPFIRQTSVGRGTGTSWHASTPRAPGYSGPEDDVAAPLRAWSNGNNGAPVAARSAGDQPEWPQNKMFRPKRPGTNTNWRQSRDEEEWRATDSARTRSMQPDKWERDWSERQNQDKAQSSWGSNRRPWVGGDEDNLPEWAMDNAEACGGTFDSSGAFHGYSNDDTNLPKQDAPYQLTRSHTHGSFARTKTAEEGSEEWWASEKAKKLSPKRFDAIEIKFKKPTPTVPDGSGSSSANKSSSSKDVPPAKVQEKPDEPPAKEPPESSTNLDDFNKKAVRFAESKTFDALMRSDINLAEASDERGNFQSVMITPNNSLRQKHQNIVAHQNFSASLNTANRPNRNSGLLQIIQKNSNDDSSQSGHGLKSQEEKVVEDIMELTLEDKDLHDMLSKLPLTSDSMLNPPSSSLSSVMTSMSQHRMSPAHLSQSMSAKDIMSTSNSGLQDKFAKSKGMQRSQHLGMTNSVLNASLGLSSGGERTGESVGRPLGMPLPGVPPPVLPAGMLPTAGNMPFPNTGQLQNRASANLNSSLFLNQATSNSHLPQVPPSSDIPMPNMGGQSNMFPMHGLQHSNSQNAFSSSIYSNIMQQPTTPTAQTPQDLTEQWYYEDPKKNIQGPFSSRDMYNWYQAGFFTPSLMVRRATDAIMRPLGSYGPTVPFAQMDNILSSFPLSSGFDVRNQGPHESLLNSQQGMGLDVMNMSNMGLQQNRSNAMDSMQYGAMGVMRNPQYGQQQMDSLWSQPSASPNMMWMQQSMQPRNENRVNNLPVFFWDQQPSTMSANPLRPELPKDMKTEDEILAQLRASQNNTMFLNNMSKTPATTIKEDRDSFQPNLTPNLDELEKLMQEKTAVFPPTMMKSVEPQVQKKEVIKDVPPPGSFNQTVQVTPVKEPVETKPTKQTKPENEKAKSKETPPAKSKAAKKSKEDKKEDNVDTKTTEEDNIKIEKRSSEPSPAKPKKEDKLNKKELEKEKKEWLKEGFTIVKAQEKAVTKESKNKKNNDEVKIAEEIERRRKEEEKAALEDKKLKNLETFKKQQEIQKQQRQQQAESLTRKAPWSAVANQTLQDTNKDGLTLAEIQRLEREKKLLQMKEQQQMIQMIAQQQAAALAREQEIQANLGWAKKKNNLSNIHQSLSEIQAEARKQSMAAAAANAAAQSQEETLAPTTTHAPWTSPANAAGFWDTQSSAAPTPAPEPPAPVEVKSKKDKKVQLAVPTTFKKEPSPAENFETWCMSVLTSWSTKIDVPTFVGFLKDIESPYEVKDYVKCYLGESKDSSDFARHFLERRSKLLRVGMVTPSDDLCSPAVAVNPRTSSGSDYQEVKGKGKKTKKNKMFNKIDARNILGFSVTAAEDRINVGDIDTA